MKHFKIKIQYDGSRYKGWQVQKNTPDTIQGKLQEILSKIAGEEIEIRGAGRTDAGVHAYGQVADFFFPQDIKAEQLLQDFNHYLPKDIKVIEMEEVKERFHARLSATQKTYRYRIFQGEKADVFERNYVECIKEYLDIAAMKKAAECLIGTHDFKAFCGNNKMKKSCVRSIYKIEISESKNEITINITGNGFLQNMIRILVGTLVEIGKGERKSENMLPILESKDRGQAGYTISSKGLALVEVIYEDKEF